MITVEEMMGMLKQLPTDCPIFDEYGDPVIGVELIESNRDNIPNVLVQLITRGFYDE